MTRSMGRATALLAVAITSAALLGGCNAVGSRLSRVTDQSFSIATGAHTDLSVTTFNGQITITGQGDATADVTVTAFGTGPTSTVAQSALDAVTVAITQTGQSISASAQPSGDVPIGGERGADVQVTLPPDASLTLVSSNGLVEAVNVNGSINATTSNGAIVTREGHGLQLQTSNGSITATAPAGQLQAHTSNASVDVLNADTVTADIETSDGAVTFSGSLAAGDQHIQTSNGTLALHLPADQGFTIDAHTTNASATTDFSGPTVNGTSISGTVGDGAARITAQTSSGTLTVTRLIP